MKRPVPMPTVETRPFWQAARRGELRLPRCRACGKLHYPPPPRCPLCLASELQWELLSGRARLLSWTVGHLDTIPSVATPFTIAEAELVEQEGLIVVALMATSGALSHGMLLDISFVPPDEGDFAYPAFRLAHDQQEPALIAATPGILA